MRSTLAVTLALLAASGGSAQPVDLSVVGIPLGGTIEQAREVARARGYAPPGPGGNCGIGRYCEQPATIENLPSTRFISALSGDRRSPTTRESFAVYFTAPPNAPRIWSAGVEQEFGKWMAPSEAAPLARDVAAELTRRYGSPSAAEGSLATPGPASSTLTMWWMWDSSGRLIRYPTTAMNSWPKPAMQLFYNCRVAMGHAKTIPGWGSMGGAVNAAATWPKPFLNARQGNCARMAQAQLSQARGKLHALNLRIVDFKAGHDALFLTTKLVQQGRASTDAERSARNRPDF